MRRMKFTTRIAVLAGIGLMLINRALLRAKLRRRRDGWRRGAGLVLRGEAATFVLSAFGLDVWSDASEQRSNDIVTTQKHLQERLAMFLAGERDSHVRVNRDECEDRVESCAGPSYTLGFEPWVDGCERFVRPEKWGGRDCSASASESKRVLLNVIGRIDDWGRADVWMRINHVAADGVPMQEMISRLERAWGAANDIVYPTPESFAPHVGPRSCVGRDGFCEMQAFLDFSPLLAWRRKVNAKLPEPITVSAALMWCLARQPALAKVYIGTTVDVPAIKDRGVHLGRCVGVVVIRPGDYINRADGLAEYVRAFNRELELTRTRQSSGAKTLDACALMRPKLAKTLLTYALDHDTRAFGTMGLTILKDAKVFGAPMGDAGHNDGFIAIGSINLPTSDGRKVGCVAIKGPGERIEQYPAIIQEAISQMIHAHQMVI